METISRRQFLCYVSTFLALVSSTSLSLASKRKNNQKEENRLPITIAVLKAAYLSEMVAHRHYVAYCRRAVEEKYPNIAYLFAALGLSEKIHADNYKKILVLLSLRMEEPPFPITISDTKENLRSAADNELIKIEKTYPDFLSKLKNESHDQAVINCMYSWKSHQQHEKEINRIRKYCRMFFGSVAKEIEGLKLDFHVCEICGSTINAPPKAPCTICNYPLSHYKKVMRPV